MQPVKFIIDPTLVAEAVREGRQLIVEIDPRIGRKKVTLGDVSPHRKKSGAK